VQSRSVVVALEEPSSKSAYSFASTSALSFRESWRTSFSTRVVTPAIRLKLGFTARPVEPVAHFIVTHRQFALFSEVYLVAIGFADRVSEFYSVDVLSMSTGPRGNLGGGPEFIFCVLLT
jgi:hypothetical protein